MLINGPIRTSGTYLQLYKIVGFPYRPDKSVPVHIENEFLAIYRNKQSHFSLVESFVTKRSGHEFNVCRSSSGILIHTIATCESAIFYGQAEQATKLCKSILRREGFVRF